jgi:upstream activation factor subunit UAF30
MAKKRKARKTKTAKKRKSGGKRKASGLTKMTYSLSPELQAVVGSKSLTRPQVVKKLWAYIKSHKCQDTKNRRMIVPDKKLSEVIGKKPVDMLKLAGALSKHIKK